MDTAPIVKGASGGLINPKPGDTFLTVPISMMYWYVGRQRTEKPFWQIKSLLKNKKMKRKQNLVLTKITRHWISSKILFFVCTLPVCDFCKCTLSCESLDQKGDKIIKPALEWETNLHVFEHNKNIYFYNMKRFQK